MHNRRITEGTRGGLIQLLQFEIVVTHLGIRSEQLTLFIQEFKHIGNDGERWVGKPEPITQRVGVSELLEKFRILRLRGASATNLKEECSDESLHSQEGTDASEEESEAEDEEEREDGENESQSRLATQYVAKKSNGSKSMSASGEGDSARTTARDNNPSIASKEKAQVGSISKLKNDQLLALLQNKPRISYAKQPNVLPVHRETASAKLLPSKIQSFNAVEVPRDMIKSNEATKAIPHANKITSSVNTVAVKSANLTAGVEITAPQHATSLAEPAVEAEKQIIEPNIRSFQDSKIHYALWALEPENNAQILINTWHDMPRILQRNIKIPKNQQTLLDRNDCWLPPEPGTRAPLANIPVSILESFTAIAEDRKENIKLNNPIDVHMNNTQSDTTKTTVLPNTNARSISNDSDSDDFQLSSSEWPNSSPISKPICDGLPPDSSMEVSPITKERNRNQLATSSYQQPPQSSPLGLGSQRNLATPQVHQILGKGERDLIADRDVVVQYRAQEMQSVVPLINSVCSDPANLMRPIEENKIKSPHKETESSQQSMASESLTAQTDLQHHIPVSSSQESLGEDFAAADSNNESNPLSQPRSTSDLSRSPAHPSDVNHEAIQPWKHDPESISSQSDLEMTVPDALDAGHPGSDEHNLRHTPPFIATDKPFLLVGRTPYAAVSEHKNEQIDHSKMCQNSQWPSVPGKLYNSTGLPETNVDMQTIDNPVSIDDLVPGTFSWHSDVEGQSTKSFHPPSQPTGNFHQPLKRRLELGLDGSVSSDAETSLKTTRMPQAEILKRKAEDSVVMSPNVTKRHKQTKQSFRKWLNEDTHEARQDPSMKAREVRRRFMDKARHALSTSLKSSRMESTDIACEHGIAKIYQPNHITRLYGRVDGKDNLPEPMSQCDTIDTEDSEQLGPVRDINFPVCGASKTVPPSLNIASPPELTQQSIFGRFLQAYPAYKGNEKHLISMCRRISALERENRMEHKSLWDDFIIRHQIEYRAHLLNCARQVEDPIPYERFYRTEIESPLFTKRIITPATISDIIPLNTKEDNQFLSPVLSAAKDFIDLTEERLEKDASQSQHKASLPSPASSTARTSSTENGKSKALKPHIFPPQDLSQAVTENRTPRNSSQNLVFSPKTSHSSSILPTMRPFSVPKSHLAASSAKPSTSSHLLPHEASISPPTHHHPLGSSVLRTRKSSQILQNTTASAEEEPSGDGPTSGSPTRPSTAKRRQLLDVSLDKDARTRAHPSGSVPKPWYLDPQNPFKDFVRADASMRGGKGNGFVDLKGSERVQEREMRIENGVVMVEKKKIDVLKWHL